MIYGLRVMKKHICMLNEESPTWHGFGAAWCIGSHVSVSAIGKIVENIIPNNVKNEKFRRLIILAELSLV